MKTLKSEGLFGFDRSKPPFPFRILPPRARGQSCVRASCKNRTADLLSPSFLLCQQRQAADIHAITINTRRRVGPRTSAGTMVAADVLPPESCQDVFRGL